MLVGIASVTVIHERTTPSVGDLWCIYASLNGGLAYVLRILILIYQPQTLQ